MCSLFGVPRDPSATLTPVARGAIGRIWRLDSGAERLAVKELFAEPDIPAIGWEVKFTAHLVAAGARQPASLC